MYFKKWLLNQAKFKLHFLIYIDVLIESLHCSNKKFLSYENLKNRPIKKWLFISKYYAINS